MKMALECVVGMTVWGRAEAGRREASLGGSGGARAVDKPDEAPKVEVMAEGPSSAGSELSTRSEEGRLIVCRRGVRAVGEKDGAAMGRGACGTVPRGSGKEAAVGRVIDAGVVRDDFGDLGATSVARAANGEGGRDQWRCGRRAT